IIEICQKIEDANRITKEYNETLDRIDQSKQDFLSNGYAEISMLENKAKRYDELRAAAELTAAEEAELKSIAEELQEVFGDDVTVIDGVTNSYNDLSEALDLYVRKRMLSVQAEALEDELKEMYKLYYNSKSEMDRLTEGLTEEAVSLINAALDGDEKANEALMSPSSSLPLSYGELDEYRQYREINADSKKQIDDLSESIKELTAAEYEQDAALKKVSNGAKNSIDTSKELQTVIKENKEAADKLTNSVKSVNSAYLEQKENGKLSYDTIMSLVEAGYASCLQTDEETNAVKLNTEAYKKLARARLEARMADIRSDIAEKTAEIEIEYKEKSSYTHSGTGSLYADRITEAVNRQKDEAVAFATAEASAELAALQDLYDNLDSYVTAEKTSKSASSTKKEIDEVKEAVDDLIKSLKGVNSAYLEQKENGKLSYDTAMSLIEAGYASVLETDKETNAVRLNTEAYKELARARIDARANDLRSRDITAEIAAELAALQDLYDNIDTYITADNNTSKSKSTTDYSEGYEAYKTEADKKLALINKELEAKKELRDKTLAYLDEEIKKRRELNEDDDMQKEIDRVSAQLKYAQLDDFSRAQMEKKLNDLQEQQEEMIWERDIQKRKEAANQAYDEAASAAADIRERINNSIETVKQIIEALKDGAANVNNIINSNNTVNNSANISLANQYLTMAQITKAVRDALIGDVTILTR
ncbi:MAG: hypothetical protein NC394_10595, partial [Bacteroides sp.]|nr:hypothetical protein [Bacteroides sp.]